MAISMTNVAPIQDEMVRVDPQTLSDLWIFRSAARLGSITAAAKRLGVTQGAVSQRVQRLEGRLGTPLFRRQYGGVALTMAGESLLEAMNSIAVTMIDALSRFDRAQRRTLVVSCLPSLATEWLMPHLDAFYEEYPDIELSVRAELVPTSLERMEDEEIDIIIDYQQEPIKGLSELGKVQEIIMPVCSPAYREDILESGPRAVITRLHDDVPWVGGPRDFEWDAWTSVNPDWNGRATSNRHFNLAVLAYHAAMSGHGIAIGRAVLVNRMLERGELIAATDFAPITGASYRILANRPGNACSPARRFAAWLTTEMTLSQQRALEIIRPTSFGHSVRAAMSVR